MSIEVAVVAVAVLLFLLVLDLVEIVTNTVTPVRVHQAAPAHSRPERIRAVCCRCGNDLGWDIDIDESVLAPPICFGRNSAACESRRRIQNPEE
jgi:hypothetical protein